MNRIAAVPANGVVPLFVLVLVGACVLLSSACRRQSAARPVDRIGDRGRLPEDPRAGTASEAQWREHMVAEERERQLGYDKRKIKEHRAVIGLLSAARTRYDRAKTEAAVAQERAKMPALIKDVRGRITAIDHWGVNSPLLKHYDALIAALSDAYPDARIAALKGDEGAQTRLRSELELRARTMSEWLDAAAASEDE